LGLGLGLGLGSGLGLGPLHLSLSLSLCMHLRRVQACLDWFRPPNCRMSLQEWHSPQLVARQPAHTRQRRLFSSRFSSRFSESSRPKASAASAAAAAAVKGEAEG